MKATKKTLAILSGALACCIAATLLLVFAGRDSGTDEGAPTYYFANYSGPEALMAASIENATGSVVVAAVGGTGYISGDYDAAADYEAIQALFRQVYRLPLDGLVENASASDAQFGLTAPQATVMLEDVNEGGLIFCIGAQTPDGEAYYTCLSGDERVFRMDRSYAELFLSDVNLYYDLSLFPSIADGAQSLSALTVRRDGQTAYRLEQVALSESGDIVYFSLTEPFRLLLGTEQLERVLLAPLRSLTGTSIVDAPADLTQYGLGDDAPTLTLDFGDGTSVTLRVGKESDAGVYVMSLESGVIETVPASSVAFVSAGIQEIVGGTLLSLNLNSVTSVTLNGVGYTISGGTADLRVTGQTGEEIPLEEFQNSIFNPLNELSIQGTYGAEDPCGSQLLSVEICTKQGGEEIHLIFYKIDERRCAVSVNGTVAFWCSKVAVDALAGAVS